MDFGRSAPWPDRPPAQSCFHSSDVQGRGHEGALWEVGNVRCLDLDSGNMGTRTPTIMKLALKITGIDALSHICYAFFFFFFFFGCPAEYRVPQARDQIQATVVTHATAVSALDP